ncbi:MAG: hypothetical protein IJE97_04820, partial [Thermoguttaceae bacterium]|nr:hypothetical protein [Thermoguttaceae bacterium]
TGRDLEVGSVVRCEIVDAQGLDLIAVPVDPEKIFVSKDERRIAAEREEAARARELGLEPPKKAAPKKASNGPKSGKSGGWKKDGGKGGPKGGGKSGGWKKGGKGGPKGGGKSGGWKKGGGNGESGKPSGNAD